jgi:hypothetical protein
MNEQTCIELYKIAAELTALAVQKTIVEHTTSDEIFNLFTNYKTALVKSFEDDTHYEPTESVPLNDERF